MSRPANFVSRSDLKWGASGGAYANPKDGLVVHYDSTNMRLDTKPHSECIAYWKRTRNFHTGPSRNWVDVGYSFFACPHDYILEGRGLNRQQAAQPGGNATHYSVTIAGGPSDPVTSGTINAVRRLRQWLVNSHGNSGRVLGHRDFIATSCPGQTAYNLVKNGTFGGSPGTPAPGSGGGGGVRSMSAIQRAVNEMGYTPPLAVDGLDGPKTQAGVRWLQNRVGASADGVWGPETERLYLAHLEDDVPERNMYTTTSGYDQTVQPGEWTTIRFDRRWEDSEGWENKTPEPSFVFGPAFYSASVGVRVDGLEKGQEFQMRLAYYRETSSGSGKYERYASMPINSPVHESGQGHFTTTWTSHVSGSLKGRVRAEVIHYGDEPVTITFARADALYWKG